ncbi:helix-turn-helix transcriptional regulator [Hymenobacter actinosclerus]|uniref:Regulatory protein, luxR family n=1 Tax=Hymenobacter actinosclerus TaxID=82805 RepID=A0A1I0A3C3_9BACT|nr:helix-turn-helix transcriptional regulator [Hymenobacter actinosclerus]SES88642.1 regulatory protein, luxR family [Hymenobacter actinosclerus]
MASLSLHHARQLNATLLPLYQELPTGPDRFVRLSEAVNALIGSELACFDVFDEAGRLLNLGGNSPTLFTPPRLALLAAHIHEHPLFDYLFVRHYPDPLKISDFCSGPQFAGGLVYNEFYRLVNVRYQLVQAFQVPGLGLVSCAFSRSRRDFSETERTLMAFLQPHLVALLRPAAPAPAPNHAAALGLTPREAEILDHLARGREDKDIAHRCGISPRTVQVHLRNLYAKLGVLNRTAAVRRVLVPA